MPDWQFPYNDETIISTAYAYYMAKDFEAGNRELRILAFNMIDEIEWFNSLKAKQPKYGDQVERERIDYTRMVIQIYQSALQFNQTAFCKELETRWADVSSYSLQEYMKAAAEQQQ